MTDRSLRLALAAMLCTGAASTSASLVGRNLDANPLTFEAYYDTVLGITWMADWNYARTSGHDADGLMNWTNAKAWADNLNYFGVVGWRLPTMVGTNEYASMWFDTLGNSLCLGEPCSPGAGPFANMQGAIYWSGDLQSVSEAWDFNTYRGLTFWSSLNRESFAVAVHDGDIGNAALVPEPAPLALAAAALCAAGLARRRRHG